MGRKTVAQICVLAAILVVAVAGPIERSGSCARQCTESNKFQYSNGKSYNYDYEMETVTTLEGTTNEASRLHMKCKVSLHVISPCEMVMKLSGVTLEQSGKDSSRTRIPADQQGTFRHSLETYPLRFAFQDGEIEHVCPSKEETMEALNIKRGILSALQTNTESLEGNEKVVESDVSGKCTTLYEVLPKGWKTQTLRKTKDLSTCTSNYEESASISQPLVKGTQECKQIFSNNRLQSVECSETHLLRTFSRHQKNGAVTRVKTTMTYVSEGASGFTGNEYFHERRHLAYDHSEENEMQQARMSRKAEEALTELCEASKDDIRPNVPALFTTLVHRMKALQHSELVNLQERVSMICSQNPRGNRMFLDAIAMCGSTGAARMMAGLIEEGKASSIDVELWLESLAFVKNPDREMLSAVTPLLNRKENFLAVSALVNTYCKKYSDCNELREVRLIASKIASALNNGCSGSNKDDMMMALKAMGNLGSNSETEEIVRKCFDNTKIDTELRVAAVQAFRRTDCSKAPMSAFTTMFRNTDENVELRIVSFLAMMRCPSFEVFSDVRDVLKDEKINQVGSFVWSYIRQAAKQSKANPEFNNLLSDRTLVNKFKTDAMKFSRVYGSSFFLESMDLGATADGHVVFTPEGYLPRSVMLNLTVDVLGSSMNIMELEGRAEGVERLVESLFGPEGYFKNDKEQYGKNPKKSKEENAIEVMGTKYNVKSRFEREPSASVDMKFYGNSLVYERFGLNKGNENSVSGSYFETMSLPDILAELAKERDINFNKNIILFDHSFTFPTGTGFPLHLTLEGSASVALKINGKMDMRSMENIDVRGKIQPSGAIEMSAVMSVHASKEISSGLKLTATLHSSTFLDGLVEVRSGRVIRSQINVPKDNIELFDLQTRIFLVRNEDQQAPAMINGDEKYNMPCYGSKFVGMELCGQIQMPTTRNNMPVFPLSGAASFKAIMRKTDPTLSQYNMELRWNPEEEGRTEAFLKFNTPGSSIERELSTGFTISQEDQTFNLWARYPNKKFNVNGKRVNTEVDKRLTFGVSVDDVEQFSVDASLGIEGIDKNVIRYNPSLTVLGRNSNKMLSLRGQASLSHGKKYSVEAVMEDIVKTPIVVKSDITIGERNEVKFSILSSQIDTSVTAFINKRSNAYAVKATVMYKFFNNRRGKLDVSGKIRDLSANSLVKYSGTASVQSSALPEYSTTLQWDTQLTNGHVENTLEISMGQEKKNAHKITVQEILRWEGSLPENKVDATLRFAYPEKYIDYSMKLEHANTASSINEKVTVRYAPEREVVAVFGGSVNTSPTVNVNANFQLDSTYSGRICQVECALKQQSDNRRDFEFTFAATQKKNKVRGLVSVADRSDSRTSNYVVKTELALPNNRKPITANGEVSFSRGHYIVNSEMSMGNGIYGGKVEYTSTSRLSHRFSTLIRTPSQAYTAEGSMEGAKDAIALKANIQGDRRINANIDLKNAGTIKTCSVNLMWDADKDASKKFTLESQIKCNENKHQGQITVSYPGRTISGSFDGGMDGQLSKRMKANGKVELEWQSGSKIRMELNGNTMKRDTGMNIFGDVKLTTPFRGAEEMALSVQHSVTAKEVKNELVAQWQRNKVSFVTDGKYQLDYSNLILDFTTRLTTTFRNYESMVGQALLKVTPNDVVTTVAARWPNNVFEVSASGTNEPKAAMINITTPFTSLSQASASISLDYQSKRNLYKIDSDVTWNGREQITVALEGRSNMASRKRTCFGSVAITSTLPGFERLSSRANYNNADREVKLETDFAWNKDKMNFGVSRVDRNTKYVYNVENRIYYTSTIKNFRNGEVKVNYNQDPNKFNYVLSTKLPYDASMSAEIVGVQTSSSDKELTMSYNSNNFYMPLPTAFTFVVKRAGEKLTSNAQLNIGESVSRADLTASAVFGSESHEINTRLSINARDLFEEKEMSLNFAHQRRASQFTTQCSVSAGRTEYRASHEIKFNDMTNFETKFTANTPYRKYNSIELNINNAHNGGLLNHKSDLTVSGKKVMALEGEFSMQQLQRKNYVLICKVNAEVPFAPEKVMIDARHEMNVERMVHRPKINMEWSRNGRLAFEGNFSPMEATPIIEGRLSSSIRNMEALGFVAKYNSEDNKQKCGQGSLRWAADSEVTWRACVDPQNNNIEFVATTPFNNFETISVRGDANKANTERSANLAVEYGRNRLTLNGKYSSKRRGNEISIQYTTPFNGWTSGSFRAAYMGRMNDFTMDVSSEWAPSNKMSVNLVHKLVSGGRLNSRIVILTPFRGYRSMSSRIDTEFESPKKTVSFVAEMEKKAMRSNFMLENDFPRSTLVTFDLTSPFMDDIRFSGDFKKPSGSGNLLTTFQWGQNKNMRTNIAFENDMPRSIMGNFDLTSTINGLEDIKMEGNYKATKAGCNVITSFKWAADKYLRTKVVFANEYPRAVLSTVELTSTLKGLEEIKVNGNYEGGKNNFKAVGSVQMGRENIRTSLEMENQYPNSMMTRFALTSPYMQDIRMSGDYSKITAGCEIAAAFELGKDKLNSKLTMENQLPRSMMSELELTSTMFERIDLMGSYKKASNGPIVNTNFKWGSNKYVNSEMSFENQLPNTLSGKFDLTSTLFESINLMGSYKKASNGPIVNTNFKWGNKYVNSDMSFENQLPNTLSGKFVLTTSFKGYENIRMNGNYERTNAGGNVVAEYQWSRNTVRVSSVYGMDYPRSMMSSFELTSPFREYEKVKFNVDLNNNNGQGIDAIFGWGEDKSIRTTMAVENKLPRSIMGTFEMRTPFENFEEIKIIGDFKKTNAGGNVQTSFQYKDKKIVLTAELNDQEVTLTMDSPFQNIPSVRLTGVLGNDNLRLTCEWGTPSNKIDLNMRLVKSDNQLEGSISLTTPFRSFRKVSMSTGLSRFDKEWRHTKGNLKISTPFQILRNFEMEGEAKLFPANYQVELSIVPSEKSNRMAASGFARRVNGVSEFEVMFDKYSMSANFKGDGYKNAEVFIKMNGNEEHSAKLIYAFTEQVINFESQISSSIVSSGETRTVCIIDLAKMMAEVSVDNHKATGAIKITKHGYGFEAKALSHKIPMGEISAMASFTNKRNKVINGQVSMTYNRRSHAAEFAFDRSNGRDITGSAEIRCPLISNNAVRFEGKVSDTEIAFSAALPNGRHSCNMGLTRTDSNNEFTFVLDSPLLESKTVSVSGKMNKQSENSIDGVLTVSGINGESRLAINLRRDQFRTFEGFMTVNLPAGPLRMFRTDIKMNSDGTPRNADLSLDIQTSLRNFRRLTTTLKTKTSANTMDFSANMVLPVKGMENLALLATLHKNEDMTRIAPRISVTFPTMKYAIFGNMEKDGKDMVLSLGYELNDDKTEGTFQLKTNEIRLILTTPYRNYERFSVLCSMSNEKNKRSAIMVFEDPANKKIVAQVSGMYNGIMNFELEADLKTPFSVLLDNNIKIRQQYRRGRFASSYQHLCSNKRSSSFQMAHTFSGSNYNGNVEILTPYESLSTSKLTYSFTSASGSTKMNVQSELNSKAVLRFEMNGDNEEKRFTITFPTMPYTLMASVKTGEYSITSISSGRTMGFTSMFQKTDNVLSHGAKLIWDEKENSVISYDWRQSARRGGSEMFGRLSFPARTFEVKMEHEPTGNGRTLKCDFFWDAARNPGKQLKFAVDHIDNSGYRSIGHKVQVTVAYPEMNKEIVTKTEFNWTPKEIMARAEMEFSRNSQQNIFVEMRGQDLSKSRKESMYQIALTGRHPASRVDIKLIGDMISNAEETSTGLKLNFLGNDGREKLQELRAKIQKLKMEMEIMARNNEDTMVMNGRYFNKDRMMTVAFDHNINSNRMVEGSLAWNGRDRKVECNINSGDEGVKLLATVLPGDMMQMELSHSNTNNAKVSDANLVLSLKQNRLIESRINWRPEVFDEAYNRLNSAYENGFSKMNRMVLDSRRQAKYEYDQASNRMSRAIAPEFSSLKNSLSMEMSRLGEDYQRMGNKLNSMYRRNEFYMRSIADASSGVVDFMTDMGNTLARGVSSTMHCLANSICNLGSAIKNGISNTVEFVNEMCVKMNRRVSRAIRVYSEMIDGLMLDMISYCIEKSFDFADYYAEMLESTAAKIDAMFNHMSTRYAPLMKAIRQVSSDIFNKIFSFAEDYAGNVCTGRACQYAAGMLNNLKEYLNQVTYVRICKAFEGYGKSMIYVAEHATETVNSAYNYVQDNSHLVAINDAAAKTFNKMREVAYHLGLDTLTFNLLEEIYSKSMQAIWSAMQIASQDIYAMRNNIKYVYEPESGRLEVEMGIPNTKFTMEDILSITQNSDFQRLWETREKVLNFDSNMIWDVYYQYKRYMDPYYWIPPFSGRAMLAGNQHFMTFDNFHFDYAGECSFLLARDFVDGNFSVSVNYVQDENLRAVRKSMVIFSNGTKIEISNDHKVTIKDAKIELPYEVSPGGVSVSWIEGIIVVSDKNRGMTLKCNFEHDLCTLDISGFYFAKTGGLFGTFNYEPHMDMTTRDNQRAGNIEEFASSWKLGGSSCKTANKAVATSNDLRANERCKELFESNNSPMRPCFKLLSPEPFMKMCLNDLSAVRENEQSIKSCTAIGAYIEKCRMEGVEMRMPKHCVRCESHDGTWMEGGDLIKVTSSPSPAQAADVVFIVEQKPCNRDIPQMLNKLATTLEEGLRKEGFRKIRFSVVGFGGEGIHSAPHVVTAQGQAFGAARTISMAMDNLPLSKTSEDSNVFTALRYAAGLPFLAGATKNFIVAKCSACQAQEMEADYSEMLRTMLDGEINLHMLMDLKLKKSQKTNRVLGLDMKYAYTTKDSYNELLGDATLLAHLRVPKDLCVPLALAINGSVFNTVKLVDPRRNMNKKTLEILAKRVLKTALPSECQLCECLATQSGLGKSVCQRCVSPVVASMVSDSTMYEFYNNNNGIGNESDDVEDEEVENKPMTRAPKNPRKPSPKNMSGRKNNKKRN